MKIKVSSKLKSNSSSNLSSSLCSFSLSVLAALLVRWGVAEAYVIPSGSMQPTLLIHDHILVNKFTYGIRIPFSKTWVFQFRKPQRGEVIVFKDPRDNTTFLIKRVIGIAGDRISYRDRQLTINGQSLKVTPSPAPSDFDWLRDSDMESAISQHTYLSENLAGHQHSILNSVARPEADFGPIEVPAGSLFMMGDHRDNSGDSRSWGFAPEENVLGQAMFVWLSCEEAFPGTQLACNPANVRWGRFFHAIN